MIQIDLASSKIFNDEIILTTNYFTSICFLSDNMQVDFEDMSGNSTINYSQEENICCSNILSIELNSSWVLLLLQEKTCDHRYRIVLLSKLQFRFS